MFSIYCSSHKIKNKLPCSSFETIYKNYTFQALQGKLKIKKYHRCTAIDIQRGVLGVWRKILKEGYMGLPEKSSFYSGN